MLHLVRVTANLFMVIVKQLIQLLYGWEEYVTEDLIRHSVLHNFPQNRMMLSFLMVRQSFDMAPRSTMRTDQLGLIPPIAGLAINFLYFRQI